ncbi:MAG TPA: MFS transporter, partial [bacterium]|nr:MFS transporter [bacterium]
AVIGCGILAWSLMTAACGLAGNFWHLFLARIGVGAGEAALLPGATSILADYFPPARRGMALGVFSAGIFLGSGIALIVGGLLIRVLEGVQVSWPLLGPLHAWQVVFVAVGLPGVLVALLMLTVAEPPRLGIQPSAMAGTRRGVPLAIVARYFHRNATTVTCHALGFTLLAFASYAGTAWIPTLFIRAHGWTATQVGVRFGIVALLVGPLGSVAGGWLADRIESRGDRNGKFKVGLLSALGVAVTAVGYPLAHSASLSFALLIPFLFFVSFVWALAPASLQEIMPNQMRGLATALYTGFLNLVGLGLGPTSVAVVADYLLPVRGRLDLAMAIVVPVAALASAVLFRLGYRPYLRTLERVHSWHEVSAQPGGGKH